MRGDNTVPDVKLQPGDIFCVRTNGVFGFIIRIAGYIWSKDNNCIYNHAGLIMSSDGQTFESLGTLKYSLLDKYKGCKVLIYRPQYNEDGEDVDSSFINYTLQTLVTRYAGVKYPAWRILLFSLPPLAKFINILRIPVCSELVAQFLRRISVRRAPWSGVMPDNLADEWTREKYYSLVYKGIW